MTTSALKKNVSNVVRELIEQGYTNIQIKEQSRDIWIIKYSRFD